MPTVLRGEARNPGGSAEPATVSLESDAFSVAVGGAAPRAAAYRDIESVLIDGGAALVTLGSDENVERWVFERFGPGLGSLARGLRDGRLRQWLSDGLVEVPDDEPIELVEFSGDGSSGVAQLLYHERGLALAPLDERMPPMRVRRADIGSVEADARTGRLRAGGVAGPLAVARAQRDPAAVGTGAQSTSIASVELRGLGASTTSHHQRWVALRDGAERDVSAIVDMRLADMPFDVRRRIAVTLVEGHPADAGGLGDAWEAIESAVLVEPAFADSYRALVARANGHAAPRWLAVAPDRPGQPEPARLWFFVGLPGNLVALELVSAGAHATYLYRVAPRASFGGETHATDLAAAVRQVSEALTDARFLREPMALPADRLREPRFLRYRLALAALPCLAAARARFVARVVHRDPASWAAALDDLIHWHASVRDDSAEWPGRAAQDAQIDELSSGSAIDMEG